MFETIYGNVFFLHLNTHTFLNIIVNKPLLPCKYCTENKFTSVTPLVLIDVSPLTHPFSVSSPDIAASEPIADMLLKAEESWTQRLKDPSTPLPSTDQRYDSGSHDLTMPVKHLWVQSFLYNYNWNVILKRGDNNGSFFIQWVLIFWPTLSRFLLKEPLGYFHL